MRVAEELTALRSNRALQRRTQAEMDRALADWTGTAEVKALNRELAAYSLGAPLNSLAILAGLLHSFDQADQFTRRVCDIVLRPLRSNPLAQVPFQHSFSNGFMTIRLASAGGAALSLLCYEERSDLAAPASASFADRDLHEIVVAGEASALVHRIQPTGKIETQGIRLAPGACCHTAAQSMSRQLVAVRGRIVVLQLARTPDRPGPTREISLSNGALVHQACGDKAASQAEMALAVLGAMKRKDALEAMAITARAGPAHLRWEAIRQVLALDPVEGMHLLASAGSDEQDELRAPAQALHRRLARQYPELLKESCEPCPA